MVDPIIDKCPQCDGQIVVLCSNCAAKDKEIERLEEQLKNIREQKGAMAVLDNIKLRNENAKLRAAGDLLEIGQEMTADGWLFQAEAFEDLGPDDIFISAVHPDGGKQSICRIPHVQDKRRQIAEALLKVLNGKENTA